MKQNEPQMREICNVYFFVSLCMPVSFRLMLQDVAFMCAFLSQRL